MRVLCVVLMLCVGLVAAGLPAGGNGGAAGVTASGNCTFRVPFLDQTVDLSPIDTVGIFQVKGEFTFQHRLCGPVPSALRMQACSSKPSTSSSFYQVDSAGRCWYLSSGSGSDPSFSWDEYGRLYLFYENGEPLANGDARHVTVEVVCRGLIEAEWSFQGEDSAGQYRMQVLTRHACPKT